LAKNFIILRTLKNIFYLYLEECEFCMLLNLESLIIFSSFLFAVIEKNYLQGRLEKMRNENTTITLDLGFLVIILIEISTIKNSNIIF